MQKQYTLLLVATEDLHPELLLRLLARAEPTGQAFEAKFTLDGGLDGKPPGRYAIEFAAACALRALVDAMWPGTDNAATWPAAAVPPGMENL